MTGSYELRDLDHAYVGELYEGKLVIDKTYGHAAYGCGYCCGYNIPSFNPLSFGGVPGINHNETINSVEQCPGTTVSVAGDAFAWNSSNTAVARLPNITLSTVAPGTAVGSAKLTLQGTHPAPLCPMMNYDPQQSINVTTQITGFDPEIIMIGSNNQQLTIQGRGLLNATPNLPTGFNYTGIFSSDTAIVLTGLSINIQ